MRSSPTILTMTETPLRIYLFPIFYDVKYHGDYQNDAANDILRFARDWRVPYTNNTAERAIRCARVKEKVSGCFRTKSGADDFARVLSFISSAALHGVSSFDAIVAAFRGGAVGVLFGVD